ncbi:MAG: ThiF family adenylyltransferase, partial [Verrucomicrobiota bacterium]
MTDSREQPPSENLDDKDKDRFGGLDRLYGGEVLKRLQIANVCVAGIGGVGSWAVEALARSGVGKL